MPSCTAWDATLSSTAKANPPVMAALEGSGQVLFEEGGLRIIAPNITSDPETGIGKWSDDAIARAIREGIAADGSTLFPVMPYEQFRRSLRRGPGFRRGLPSQPAAGAQRSACEQNSVSVRPPRPGGAETCDRNGAGARQVHACQIRRVPGQDGNLQRLPHAAQSQISANPRNGDGRRQSDERRACTPQTSRQIRRASVITTRRCSSRPCAPARFAPASSIQPCPGGSFAT